MKTMVRLIAALKNLNLLGVLLTLFLFAEIRLSAQCKITSSAPVCVGEPVLFSCNSIGASNFQWDFNGEGSNNSICDPSFVFSSPGVKTINLSLQLANGKSCSSSLVINVLPKPVIRMNRISPKTQCFANNSFCFVDSSRAGDPQDSICNRRYAFDDGTFYNVWGSGPKTICHSFQDPSGGTYGLTVEITSCNGCVSKTRYNAIAVVLPSLGLNFTSPQPRRCDSVILCITNKSLVPLDSIKKFVWDWGDGLRDSGSKTSPVLWKANIPNGVCHFFKTQGPRNGEFDTRLTVTTFFGCMETFTFKASATNIIIKPKVIADRDSVCFSDPVINFSLKDGPIPQAANPLFIYEQPPIPANISRAWTGTHKFSGPGPHKILFSFTSTIPGCGKTVFDTILVLGPQSLIEGNSGSGLKFMDAERNFQCTITDTVKFTNLSKFYHNDKNFKDDDSTYNDPKGFNKPLGHAFNSSGTGQNSLPAYNQKRGNQCIERIWDFDDRYCLPCTTDTRKNENTGINCRYSKDSLPQHWYTPWDEVYKKYFAAKPQIIGVFNKDSGYVIKKRIWAEDSIAIVRDTTLYYGNNPLAISTKDSFIYNGMKKVMVNDAIYGKSKTYISKSTRFYLPAGDTVHIDLNNGLPPIRFIGSRYITVQPGSTLDLQSPTDKLLFNVWVEYTQDTILLSEVQSGQKVWKKIKINGFVNGDSVNPATHRQLFYLSNDVRCYSAKLTQKDICHPMACASETIKNLSLFPPSARNLRHGGITCAGNGIFGITFILDDSKPGCTYTWAEINLDTANNANNWVPAIGKNLSPGQISMGGLPPVNPPYQVPIPGYQMNGAPGTHYSLHFSKNSIKDTLNGYLHTGLITGNGIWNSGVYPNNCQDTVFYRNFAKLPIIDNNIRIVNIAEGSEFTKICKGGGISLAFSAGNASNADDADELIWSLRSENSGKYYNQIYALHVTETYERFRKVHPDSNFLMNYLKVVKRAQMDNKFYTKDSQYIPLSRINKWHTEADISEVFDLVKPAMDAQNINIFSLSKEEIAASIWNRKGVIGKAWTGSKGFIDTSGYGHKIRFSIIADQKKILHFRDTSLSPLEQVNGVNNKTYFAYSFTPEYNGFFVASLKIKPAGLLNSECESPGGNAKKVIVGFYSNMNFTDTIICHGQQIRSTPEFRYFEIYPEITFRMVDPRDYWHERIQEAGNVNREGFTKTDLNKADDNISDPKTIFGSFPYSITGLGKPLILSGGSGSLYYNKDTGAEYVIRTAASDSTGCSDTLSQSIYTTAARAVFKIDQTIVQCKTIVSITDSSYIIDPCKTKFNNPCDRIVKWTINWGSKGVNSQNVFFNTLPQTVSHSFEHGGTYTITMKIETMLGCISIDSVSFYIPGPVPSFTYTDKVYCINEKVEFKNTSQYLPADSSIWVWEFGDEKFDYQYSIINSSNDTMNHRYQQEGTYKVRLHNYYKFLINNQWRTCMRSFPDTTIAQPEITIEVIDCDSNSSVDIQRFNAGIEIYPNPAINSVTIVTQEATELLIIDAKGAVIETILCDGKKTFDLRHLAGGLYFICSSDRRTVGKLIVE